MYEYVCMNVHVYVRVYVHVYVRVHTSPACLRLPQDHRSLLRTIVAAT